MAIPPLLLASLRCGAAAIALSLAACRAEPAEQPAAPPAENKVEPEPATKVLPAPEITLEREALLLAVVRARSAAATGVDDRQAQAELANARFQFTMRLGCTVTPAEADGARKAAARRPRGGDDAAPPQPEKNFAASYDAETRRVELSAAPDITIEHPVIAAIVGEQFEAAEGFWVPHPWLLSAACAPGGAASSQGLPVAIAQFFTSEDSRIQRRDGRAYQARETLPEGSPAPAAGGWNLLITGRLRPLDGRVILCPAVGPGTPACVISVEIDRVAIVKAEGGEQLAEWSRG